ncbi:MAG: hypothetical protein PHT44_04640 [Candidatus Portnoybacteria bacterium]|nr:hypothetical protein [Candidatus Portnoybacteria bacterium]MDD4983205.1 hypothetical protein [Candidatus Portnoybacteria bacterium]
MNLIWGTCGNNGSWCGFFTVNLAHPYFDNMEGVYIIWQEKGPIIRVGQGNIRDRLSEHRKDSKINIFNNLLVTWAVVSEDSRNGVERYLANRLNPIVGSNFPNTNPLEVNLPWPF